jgi:hypothetical protein
MGEIDPTLFNYGLMCLLPLKDYVAIVHFMGTENPPTEDDVKHLLEELKTDPEFGLTGVWDKLTICVAPKDVCLLMREQVR